MTKLIDTHAHLNDYEAYPDCGQIIENFADNNIQKVIVVGFSYDNSVRGVELAKNFENIFAAVGTHPSEVNEVTPAHYDYFLTQGKNNPKVVAIGECGLDYHYEGYDRAKQAEVFVKHLEIAFAAKLPVIIHLRDAFSDMLNLLKEHKQLLFHGGLLHCFSGSVEYMSDALKLGLDIALGGTVTFKNAAKLIEVAKAVPLDRLHLETDAPYLAPVPYRGARNEPKYVNLIAEKIAELREITIEELSGQVAQNAYRLFYRMGENK